MLDKISIRLSHSHEVRIHLIFGFYLNVLFFVPWLLCPLFFPYASPLSLLFISSLVIPFLPPARPLPALIYRPARSPPSRGLLLIPSTLRLLWY